MLRLLRAGASGLRIVYLRQRLQQEERYAGMLRRDGMLSDFEQSAFDRSVEALRVEVAIAEAEHQRIAP